MGHLLLATGTATDNSLEIRRAVCVTRSVSARTLDEFTAMPNSVSRFLFWLARRIRRFQQNVTSHPKAINKRTLMFLSESDCSGLVGRRSCSHRLALFGTFL